MLVAGCANYARSFRTNDDGEPDMISDVKDDTLAVACGVSPTTLQARFGTKPHRTTMRSSARKTAQYANI